MEAARLALMQLLLQRRGFKLSPITALYYIAPAVVPLLLLIAIVKVVNRSSKSHFYLFVFVLLRSLYISAILHSLTLPRDEHLQKCREGDLKSHLGAWL